ncbi:MAG: hypothetical protein IKQ92_13320 [Clostridia bacterium]|nr:hypothetical protein [Clostridia bacterium]
MAEKKLSAAEQKKLIGEELWLRYFNRILFENGLITEQERSRMSAKIDERSAKIRRGR